MADRCINVIGAGLAGCEAAWQAAKRGVKVRLYEMKPKKFSPAHKMHTFAELVCSNSLRSDSMTNAVGLLKEEMRRLDSLVMRCADETRLPAGGALAVDREEFSRAVTEAVTSHPNISIHNEEVTSLPENGISIIATGPLTSDAFAEYIMTVTGRNNLYFYDAAAPIVTYESIDMTKAFRASRYGKGNDDYINCPMDKEQYEPFRSELVRAETVPLRDFEKMILFSGCMRWKAWRRAGATRCGSGPETSWDNRSGHGKEPYGGTAETGQQSRYAL